MLRSAWQSLLELLYPYRCPICNKIVEAKLQLCSACLSVVDIRFVNADIVADRHIEGLIFGMHYRQIKHVLHAAKFENKPQALTALAAAFAASWSREHSEMLSGVYGVELTDCICVVVPTDYKRRLRRGYDIPELLFAAWMEQECLTYHNILRRIRFTAPQFELNRSERRLNVANSVEAIVDVQGKNVILLDDIFTTGASMNEAARALKLKGARKIVAIAFASDLE